MNSGFTGQVGQESNLQPAVLEPAAVRSATFRDVHKGAENRPLCRLKVSGSSPTYTGVGVNIGVKAVGLCLFLNVTMRWGVALSSLDLLGVAGQSS